MTLERITLRVHREDLAESKRLAAGWRLRRSMVLREALRLGLRQLRERGLVRDKGAK